MRKVMMAAGLLACLALAGCSDGGAAEDTAPVAKKSLARPAQPYAGQEQIESVQAGSVTVTADGGLDLKASGMAATAGWTAPAFLPRIYAATPPDGVYEVDIIATKPSGEAAATPTPVEVSSAWDKYKDGRVKGVRFMTKTNDVVAMAVPAT